MLSKLNDIQLKDLEIDRIEAEKKQIPPELTALLKTHAELKVKLQASQAIYDDLRKQVNSNELEIDSMSARRKAASEASLSASSAKEASQYQNQELQFATRVQELEEDTMPLIEKLDTAETNLNELKTEMETLEPELEAMNQAEEDRVIAIEESTVNLKLERAVMVKEIPTSLLKQYEQVRRAKRGTGLALIVNSKRCGGCNMQLPIHVVQKAKKDGQVTRCPSCGRILWNKTEPED